MCICEKIKTNDNNNEQKTGLHNLDRQATNIYALSSGNVAKNE